MRTEPWSTGAVDEAIHALISPAAPPLIGRGSKDPHLSRDMRNRTALFHPKNEGKTTARYESRIFVQVSILGVWFLDSSTLTQGLTSTAELR